VEAMRALQPLFSARTSFRARGARSARGSERGVLGEQPREDVAELAAEHRGGASIAVGSSLT
jgi:hypothetical protein